MNEKQAWDSLHNVMTDHNFRHPRDYLIKSYGHGCFEILFCPKRCVKLDIHYFYKHIPDIKVFKVSYCDAQLSRMKINIKIKLRGC